MFLKQVAQNATTWLGTLQKLANLRIEYEQIKENLFETNNCLQTYNIKLETMQQTLKFCDKKLVIIKGQLNKVQHENQNLSNKLKKAEHAVSKIENLQHEYAKFNNLNWKIHNNLNISKLTLNNAKLQQNGGIEYATIEYHNQFGTNMFKVQGTTSSCSLLRVFFITFQFHMFSSNFYI